MVGGDMPEKEEKDAAGKMCTQDRRERREMDAPYGERWWCQASASSIPGVPQEMEWLNSVWDTL